MMVQSREFSSSAARVEERCKMLRYAGLIAPIHDEIYELTTDGQLYLQEEIDARYRPWPTVNWVLRG